jgi:hypothetical protein
MTELTPHALAQTRRWATLLATDPTAPAWRPFVGHSTPSSLRAAALWLIDQGHAPGLTHEMVCILLAIYVVDVASGEEGGFGGALHPRDAA